MLTKNAVAATLKELVEEKGADYVYPQWDQDCEYSQADGPSCIVGYVIARLDPEKFEEIAAFEEDHGSFGVGSFNTYEKTYDEDTDEYVPAYDYPTLEVEDGVISLLRVAQVQQDAGRPWGVAVAEALAVLND